MVNCPYCGAENAEVEVFCEECGRPLKKPEKKMLLRLVDLEAALRDQACLNSFISGYRLAQGIQQELLADLPPYNFEDEDERQACQRMWEG